MVGQTGNIMDLKSIMDMVDREGFAIVRSNRDYKTIPKKGKYLVFSNRRTRQSIIINPKKLKK